MHIDELENYNLADAVRFHDELNPGLWGKDEHLRPEVREALLRIADDFREFLGVSDLEVKDITISGSNAAYNYTPNSDIDLHLVVDIPELSDEVYRELFNAKKYQYNDQHDIRIRGADVELYVQPAEDTHVSQGIYSVAQQKWLSVPRRKRAKIDDNSVRHKAEDLEARIQQAIGSGDREVMDRLWQKIKDIRKSGLEQKGEFSTENLVFKILRVNGLIEKLQTARQSARDQELSLNERKRRKSRKRYAYGGYWYPGFGYAGSSEAGSDSGGDGGGESVREDVGSTWDGVSPTTRMFTSEQEQDNNNNVIKTFARFVAKQIGMKQLPRIRITRDPNWSGRNGTFGHYDQNNQTLTISLANRHIMDVLRTMAHELVHAHQDTKHGLPATAGKTGSPYENEANAVAGRIMRRWAKQHGDMFDQLPMEDNVDEDLKSTLGAAAAAACIAGTPGCATTDTANSPTADVLRGVQTVGRTAQAVKDMGVGGAREELINQLRDKLRNVREATGYIPTKKQARDPRFVMALTTDIQPGQIGKEANKLNLKTDSQGHPALLMKRLNNLLESVKAPEQLEEDELFEINMSPSNLAKLAKNIDARAGLEFEMYVPNVDADGVGEFESEPDYDADEGLDFGYTSWRAEIREFFRNNGWNSLNSVNNAINEFEEEFYEWLEEKKVDYIDSVEANDRVLGLARSAVDRSEYQSYEEYQAALNAYIDENEEALRDEVLEEYTDDLDSLFEEFADEQDLTTMARFGDRYNLDWPYWTEYEGGDGVDIDDVARDFGDAIGRPVTTGGYHSGRSSQTNNYRVETDSSLNDPADYGDAGLEFVSPPLTIPEMLQDIKKITRWANRVGAYTNSTTGLHMNVSVPDYNIDDLDYVKLALFLGDKYILDQFGRASNTYCKSALRKIEELARKNPDKLETMLKQMQGNLNSMASKIVHTGNTDKYTSINTQNNRVEFRGPGNDYLDLLNEDPGQVTNTLLRTVVALDAAMRPDAYRQEYMKKLYKLLTPTEFTGQRGKPQQRIEPKKNEVSELLARYIAGDLPKTALKSFISQIKKQRSQEKPPAGSQDQEFTGYWEVVSRPTDEVVHTFSGIGNAVADAVGYANRWVDQTGFSDPVYVRPLMRPRDGAPRQSDAGGPFRAPQSSIYQIVNDRNGNVLVPGDQYTWADIQSMANNLLWNRQLQQDGLRIIDLANNQGYNLDGRPVRPGEATAPATERFTFIGTVSNDEIHSGEYSDRDRVATVAQIYADALGEPVAVESARGVRVFTAQPEGSESTPAVGGEQSSDANYEIVDRQTGQPVFRFIANTDEEAGRKYTDWLSASGYPEDTENYGWRRIAGRGIPGSTAELARQRSEQPQVQEFRVSYTVTYAGEVRNNAVTVQARNADAAVDVMRTNLQRAGYTVDRIEAEPVAAAEQPAQGTESLPPGNTRWLILDPNDREVYSFVHRSNQGEANQYAIRWLQQNGLLGSGEFMVVPAR